MDIGNVIFIRVNPDYFEGSEHDFFEFLFSKTGLGITPGNVFGMPQKKGEAWFRITIIHAKESEILKNLQRIEECLLKYASSFELTLNSSK